MAQEGVASATKQCEVLTGPLKIPCGNPTTRQYKAICQQEHVRIKWACEECVHHPSVSCSTCVKNGAATAAVIITPLNDQIMGGMDEQAMRDNGIID